MIKFAFQAAAISAAFFVATQASAHDVMSASTPLPVIAAGASTEMTINCPAGHYAVSGGYADLDQLNPTGPLEVTASYPSSTRSWTVEFTNGSGRPTGMREAEVTLYVTCDHHW